ncbi:MAG: hypothetical protein LBS03_05105 [Bacteroidales bacterium]|jgi:hypothetical protein|nr:hypothetical protein [Bacteroidales bacterium]
MNDKYLIVKGVSGLGERLGAAAAAIDYARRSGRKIYVDWSDGKFGKPDEPVFYKYFRLNGVERAASIEEIFSGDPPVCYPALWGASPHMPALEMYARIRTPLDRTILRIFRGKGDYSKLFRYWQPRENYTSGGIGAAVKAVSDKECVIFGGNLKQNKKEDVVFFADVYPRFSNRTLRENVSLTDPMNDEINRIAASLELADKTIGVHVRMTDRRISCQPEYLLERVQRVAQKLKLHCPKIFLATDSEDMEDYFREKHPATVFTEKWRPEGEYRHTGVHHYAAMTGDYSKSERVLKDSIIDMWLLSKCEYLIYQRDSNFSIHSSILKNDPKKTFSW